MQTSTFEIDAEDGHTIYGSCWQGSGDVVAIVQIFHGLGEHHRRYERFASVATERGIVVIAHDHRGHGPHTKHAGHFSDNKGWRSVVNDGLRVNDMIGDRFAGVPIVLLGHSMGSYIAQSFSFLHDYRLTALILSASTWPAKSKLIPGRMLARIESWRMGIRGESALLNKLGFGDFNKSFEPSRTSLDWLSRDNAEVDANINDPLCGGSFSCGLWLDLMGGLTAIASDQALQQIRAELPILLTGGANDPVGGERGISELAMHYTRSGHNKLTVKIYPDGRHEMLNETNRDEFSTDLLDWVEKQLPAVAGT